MNDLARTILALQRDGARIVYGTATALNTVELEGADTAVTLPALTPVTTGDYCAVVQQGADRLILGPIGSTWKAFTPSWTNLNPGSGGLVANSGEYQYLAADTMLIRTYTRLGTSGFSVGATPRYLIPDGRTADVARSIGQTWAVNDGGADSVGTCQTAWKQIYVYNNSLVPYSATVPHTWAANDNLTTQIVARLA